MESPDKIAKLISEDITVNNGLQTIDESIIGALAGIGVATWLINQVMRDYQRGIMGDHSGTPIENFFRSALDTVGRLLIRKDNDPKRQQELEHAHMAIKSRLAEA